MQQAIFYPVLAMVALAVLVWMQMYVVRIGTAVRERIPSESIRPTNRDLPLAIVTSGDNWRNLFEAPTLFYVLAIIVFVLERVDEAYLIGCWLYVALRVLHSIVHVSYNKIMHRFIVYVVGCLVLWFMWARLALQLLA
ncbi:MAG: MAPEG family protein [Pseudomonadota bacterium]